MPSQNILEFSKIEKSTIFCDDFINFRENNKLNFQKKKTAILYGPNGTGKTSLSKIMMQEEGTLLEVTYNNIEKDNLFHVISDQNGRNIIKGTAKDFFLGDNIEKEYDLRDKIDKEFILLKNTLISSLKTDFTIKKKSNTLVEFIKTDKLKEYVSQLANTQDKGKNIERTSFINYIDSLGKTEISEYDKDKLSFLINNCDKKESLIYQIISIKDGSISKVEEFENIEKHHTALEVLNKFESEDCIVCDNTDYDRKKLISQKSAGKDEIYNKLDPNSKMILESLIKLDISNDPFAIKDSISKAITEGNKSYITSLIEDFEKYLIIFNCLVSNMFIDSMKNTDLSLNNKKYNEIVSKKLDIEDSDLKFIQDFVSSNIEGKKISLEREDDTKNIKILINQKVILP